MKGAGASIYTRRHRLVGLARDPLTYHFNKNEKPNINEILKRP
jgi:hypothetical protein